MPVNNKVPFSVELYAQNLRDYAAVITPKAWDYGLNWYNSFRQDCLLLATSTGVPLDKVIHVVAALCPNVTVKQNLIDASLMLRAYASGQAEPPAVNMLGNRYKAWAILHTRDNWQVILKGAKCVSFAGNIAGDMDLVTVDRHYHYILSRGLSRSVPTGNRYLVGVQATRIVASELKISPAGLQGAGWYNVRDLGIVPVWFLETIVKG